MFSPLSLRCFVKQPMLHQCVCPLVYVPRKRTGAAVASVQRLWIASLHETPPHVEQLSNLLPGQGFITVLVQLVEECV